MDLNRKSIIPYIIEGIAILFLITSIAFAVMVFGIVVGVIT